MNTLFTVLGVSIALSLPMASAVTLQLNPLASSAVAGDNVSLALTIDGLGDFSADSLGAFDVDIEYDSSVLTVTGSTLTTLLGDIDFGEALDFGLGDSGGLLNLSVVSLLEANQASCTTCLPPYLDDLQLSSFTLAEINFLIAPEFTSGSTTAIDIARSELADAFGTLLPVTSVSSATISNAATVVSVPGSLLLLFPIVVTMLRRASFTQQENRYA